MNKRILLPLILIGLFATNITSAQKGYWAAGGEMIFSLGTVATDSTPIKAVMRWSPVLNALGQYHYNFSHGVGLFTGIGLRNVGLISHVTAPFNEGGNITNKEFTVKERSYSLGVPLALKFGNMEKETYLAVGAEAEMMFAYKRKSYESDNKSTKIKSSSWFSDDVNIFNPSAFAEFHSHGGAYIRFKYYLMDFLNYQGITLVDAAYTKSVVSDYGPASPLWYISIGIITSSKQIEQDVTKPADKSAYIKGSKKNRKSYDSASNF